MAARVCEPIFPSSEPEEIPWRSSASWASRMVWTGRGKPATGESSGAFVLACVGLLGGTTATVEVAAGGGEEETALCGFIFFPVDHKIQSNPAAARMTNSQRKAFPDRRERASRCFGANRTPGI